ncbi:MAG: MFS transporter, partial [Alphaproteobacteria bacterium]
MNITRESKNVGLLAFCQALGQTQMVLVFSVSSIIGASLGPNPGWATVPITIQFVLMTASTVPAALWMKKVGRANGFITFLVIGCIGASLMVYALYLQQFWLFCLGSGMFG